MAEPVTEVSQETTIEETTTETTTPVTDDAAKWKSLSRKNENELKKTLAELEKLRSVSMSDQERAVAEAKAQGRQEASAELRLERVRDKIEAKAAGKMADPEDAAALLGDLAQFIENDGTIDSKGIASAIDHLIETKPYLTAQPGNGSAEGGARGEPAKSLAGDALTDALTRAVGAPRSTR